MLRMPLLSLPRARPMDPASARIVTWLHQASTIARFTLLEGARTRLPWIASVALLCLAMASLFVQHLAITESERFRLVFLGAACRLVMVALLCQHVAASMQREFQDHATELLLSLPLPRPAYYVGKLLGFIGLGLCLSFATALVLAIGAEPTRLVAWSALLALELTLMASVTLFCSFGTQHVVAAVSLSAAFYVLARSAGTLQFLAHSPLIEADGAFARAATVTLDVLLVVLPDLSRFARSSWLVDAQAPLGALRAAAVQSAIYLLLTASAGICDLKRRSF